MTEKTLALILGNKFDQLQKFNEIPLSASKVVEYGAVINFQIKEKRKQIIRIETSIISRENNLAHTEIPHKPNSGWDWTFLIPILLGALAYLYLSSIWYWFFAIAGAGLIGFFLGVPAAVAISDQIHSNKRREDLEVLKAKDRVQNNQAISNLNKQRKPLKPSSS